MNANLFWQLGKSLFVQYFTYYDNHYPNYADSGYWFDGGSSDIMYTYKSIQVSKQTITEKPKKVVLNMQGRNITITDNYGYTEVVDLSIYIEKGGNWYYYTLPKTIFTTSKPANGLTVVNFLQDFEFDFSSFGTSQNYSFYLMAYIDPAFETDWNTMNPDNGIYEPITRAYTEITDKTNAPYFSFIF